MFVPRAIRSSFNWEQSDGIKLYTISVDAAPVDQSTFHERLAEVKRSRSIAWAKTPHFAIFHKGASCHYLILCWWGNDNELFTSVSVLTDSGWVEQPERYSFCLYDLEVFWDERNSYIETIDCAQPDLSRYRRQRRTEWLEA